MSASIFLLTAKLYNSVRWFTYIFSEQPFDYFVKKEGTSCYGTYDYYLYTETPEECPTKCRMMGKCSAFTLVETDIVYNGLSFLKCQLYGKCVVKDGVAGSDLYSFEKW